jgi:hypothetical protein
MRGTRNGRGESHSAMGRARWAWIIVIGLAVGLAAHRLSTDAGGDAASAADGSSKPVAANVELALPPESRGIAATEGSGAPTTSDPKPRPAAAGTSAIGKREVNVEFQLPASAKVGEAFELRIVVEARQAISRVAFEIRYDPALMRVRTAEEIDYGGRAATERPLLFEEMGEGRAAVVLMVPGGSLASASTAIVQFEALAPGWAQVDVAATDIRDTEDAPVSRVDGERTLGIALTGP